MQNSKSSNIWYTFIEVFASSKLGTVCIICAPSKLQFDNHSLFIYFFIIIFFSIQNIIQVQCNP